MSGPGDAREGAACTEDEKSLSCLRNKGKASWNE